MDERSKWVKGPARKTKNFFKGQIKGYFNWCSIYIPEFHSLIMMSMDTSIR